MTYIQLHSDLTITIYFGRVNIDCGFIIVDLNLVEEGEVILMEEWEVILMEEGRLYGLTGPLLERLAPIKRLTHA